MEQSHGNANGKVSPTQHATDRDGSLDDRANEPMTAQSPAIRFEALEPRVLLSGDVNPAAISINGSIDAPGQQNHYQFTVQDDKRVVFDSLTNRSDLSWSLTGPNGAVDSRNFSDDGGSYYKSAYDLTAGTYTLTVGATADATGSYAMRIVDATAAADLTPGTQVTDTLVQGNETSVYKFDGTAGQQFYFKAGGTQSTAGNSVYWRLVDPYGRQETGVNSLNYDANTFALKYSGEYLLLVEGAQSNTAPVTYNFTLQPVNDTQQSLTLDQNTNVSIAQSGQTAYYHFSLDDNTSVLFDRLSGGNFNWSLTGPLGQVVGQHQTSSSDYNNALALVAGDYTLAVNVDGGVTGNYAYRLLTGESATSLQTGSQVSDTLDTANGSRLYKVSLTQGQKLYVNGQTATGGSVSWRLLDPYGNRVTGNTLGSNIDPFTAPVAGDYWLVMDGSDSNTATATVSYTFQLNSVPDITRALTLGAPVTGSIDQAGQSMVYTVHLAARAQLAFDSLSNRSDMLWTLSGPRGVEVSRRGFNTSDGSTYSVQSLPAGDYTIVVQGSGAATGAFGFNLIDLSTATVATQGTAFGGTLTPGSSSAVYQFSANAGDSVKFKALGVTGGSGTWRLVDMYGRSVAGPSSLSSDGGAVSLSASGNYTLIIEGAIANGAPVTYQGRIDNLGNTPPNALPTGDTLTLGSVTAGTLAAWNTTKTYNFTLNSTTQLVFDGQTQSNAMWTLVGPRGTEFSQTNVYYSDSLLTLPPGTYALTLQGASSAGNYNGNGAYAFRVTDVTTLPALQLGQSTVATRTPDKATVGYRVQGSAGTQLVLNVDRTTGGYSPSWQLIGPQGQVINGASGDTPGTVFTLPADGMYTLLDIGYTYSSYPSGTDTFTLSQVSVSNASIAINDLATASLAGRQSIAQFSLTLGAPEVISFDSLISATGANTNVQWLFRGSNGATYGWYGFGNDQGGTVYLPAGQYTLVLRNTSDTPANVQFRLLDRNAAHDLVLGSPTQTTLTSDQTTIYRFDATAGDHFYYVADHNGSNVGAYWQVVDPRGATVSSGYAYNYYDTIDIPAGLSGEYLLVFTPYNNSINPAITQPLQFTLGKRVTSASALALDSTTSGAISQPGQTISYSFTLDAPTSLLMNTPSLSNLYWTLIGPRGAEATQSGFGNTNSVFALPAGNYVLTVSRNDLQTGAFSFALQSFSQMPEISLDQPTQAAINQDFSASAGHFTVATDGDYTLDIPASDVDGNWRLFNAQGKQVSSGNTGNTAPQLHLVAGDYALVWTPAYYGGSDGTLTYTLHRIVTTSRSLVANTVVTDTIGAPAQRLTYDFDISAATQVLFDAITARSDIEWELTGPNGNIVSRRALAGTYGSAQGEPISLAAIGHYRLTISGDGGALGDFAFQLIDFAGVPALPLGNDRINVSPGNSAAYAVQGSAGDYLRLNVSATAGGVARIRVYDANGAQILAPSLFTAGGVALALPHDGSYFVIIDGDEANTDAVAITCDSAIVTPAQGTIALGSDVSGQLSVTGVPDQYHFVSNGPALLMFDALAGSGLSWTLRAADGTAVKSGSLDALSPVRVGAGVYTLEISAASAASLGNYALRMLDLAQAAPLPLDQPTVSSVTDTHAQAWAISATQDNAALTLAVSAAGAGGAAIRVYDANGNLLASGSGNLASTTLEQGLRSGNACFVVIDGGYLYAGRHAIVRVRRGAAGVGRGVQRQPCPCRRQRELPAHHRFRPGAERGDAVEGSRIARRALEPAQCERQR
jgi:hypothetical protein